MTWPIVALGEVARQRKSFITIDNEAMYKRCRVQTGARGVVLRDAVPGSEIKTKKQQVCRSGDFIVAEIDAKAGGYGLVPAALEGAVVSSHYFLFEVDEDRLDREFLGWYSRSNQFFNQVRAVGSTNYAAIRPANVLSYRVPLPSIPEQRRIVERLDAAATAIDARSRTATCVDAEIDAMLAAAFARIIADAPPRPMAEVAPLVRRSVAIDSQAEYGEIGVRSFYRGIFLRRTMTGEEFSWQKLFRIEENDLVFSNLMAWERAVALAGSEHAGAVGNHRMLTCEVDQSICLPHFIYYFFKTEEGYRKILAASPGTMVRNKTLSNKLLPKIEVPIPSLDAQHWFDGLQAKARSARLAQAAAATELAGLLPSMLHKAFGDSARTV
ncbi:restriction endonuclease subunit S [uncultured Sphingomonas sp.]|uniref:restriction endonuclease subunit S n=1 Tax=uncultured Sphingomonas sp. TaxID=158754 RepID=UPI0025E5DB0A|nr:restriction endonuclease subunit S [uncultured Sphingomonas sp.]